MKICVIGGTGNISPSLVRDLLETYRKNKGLLALP